MLFDKPFTKENLDSSLKELAKEFRKKNRTGMEAEIILVGDASILINYGFREMTYDMDAIISPRGLLKAEITSVRDRLGLPTGWLNTDFVKTNSYSPRLIEYSKYYKTFSNIVKVRTVTAQFLVAMKLMSGRQYKHDLSDVVGILVEQQSNGNTISLEQIKDAAEKLYGSYNSLPESSRNFIESVFQRDDLATFFEECKKFEQDNKDVLIQFQEDYPDVLSADNLESVLEVARSKKVKKE